MAHYKLCVVTEAKKFSAVINSDFTSESSFYQMQKIVDPVVQDYGQELVANAKMQCRNLIYILLLN